MTQISAWLPTFISNHTAAGVDRQRAALRHAIDRFHWGTWLTPDMRDGHNRPLTHQHEIDVCGIASTGATADEAAANWFRTAIRTLPKAAA